MDEAAALERLVRRYSPSGHETPAVREFCRVASELGYATRVDGAGNGIARRGRGHPRVVFLGHIDTVDGRLPVRRRAGRLYGRGSVDAKGPLAAALLAGTTLPPRGEYTVIAAVGEETDSPGARYLLRRLRPDSVIAGEPSGWDGVTIGYKGELRVAVEFRGRRTHYASPHPTTADRAWDWVAAARGLAASYAGASPFRSLTFKLVTFDTRQRGDEEVARVTADFRLPPQLSTASLWQQLPRGAKASAMKVLIRVEPLEVDRSNPVVASLVEGIRAAGGRPTLWRKTGTSDLNLVTPAWKVPGAAYGPGDARLDHTDRESVSIAELHRSVTVLRRAVSRLMDSGLTLPRSADGA